MVNRLPPIEKLQVEHRIIILPALQSPIHSQLDPLFQHLHLGDDYIQGRSSIVRIVFDLVRQKYDLDELTHTLTDKVSLQFEIFNRYRSLVYIRTQQSAFHPNGDQVVLDIDNRQVLGFSRTNPDKTESIIVLYNFSCKKQTIRIKNNSKHSGTDLMTKEQVILSNPITLAPLMFRWVKLNVPA